MNPPPGPDWYFVPSEDWWVRDQVAIAHECAVPAGHRIYLLPLPSEWRGCACGKPPPKYVVAFQELANA